MIDVARMACLTVSVLSFRSYTDQSPVAVRDGVAGRTTYSVKPIISFCLSQY